MLDKLQSIVTRFEEIDHRLQNPQVTQDLKVYQSLLKERSQLEPIVQAFKEYQALIKQKESTQQLLEQESDTDLIALARQELKDLEQRIQEQEHQLKILLLPKDPNDEKNVILEIRAAAGGDEASLFAADLFRMYSQYAHKKGWTVEILSAHEGNVGGFKEIIARIGGQGVYSRLKFESGVHRVQRVPVTEASGRIHTSTATVAVIPEMEMEQVRLNMDEVRVDVMRAQGAGGQSVNRTESAVRVVHIPTGIVVTCQESRSQNMNRQRALQILYSKLVQMQQEQQQAAQAQLRQSQIGTGERAQKVRTYNFPQSRITDHRIDFTTHAIDDVLNGDLDVLIEPLILHHQTEQLNKVFQGQ